MRLSVIGVAVLASALAACGPSPATTPASVPTATPTATATATPSPTPTATPAPTPTPAPSFTVAQLIATVKATWKGQDPGDADCYTLSPAMNFSSCPWTDRLVTRVRDYYTAKIGHSGGGYDVTCGCQGGAGTPTYGAKPVPGGGTVSISWSGGTSLTFTIVAGSGGQPLVDDIVYHNGVPGMDGQSIYSSTIP